MSKARTSTMGNEYVRGIVLLAVGGLLSAGGGIATDYLGSRQQQAVTRKEVSDLARMVQTASEQLSAAATTLAGVVENQKALLRDSMRHDAEIAELRARLR